MLERLVLIGGAATAMLETAAVVTSVDSPKHGRSGLHSSDGL